MKNSKSNDKEKQFALDLKYKKDPLNFYASIKINRIDIFEKHMKETDWNLNKNFTYSMPPGFLHHLPLIVAIAYHSYDVLIFLLNHDADPNAVCHKMGITPLQYAKNNDPKAYQVILDFQKNHEN